MAETFEFQAEINQLMSLIINAFYSNRDIFLRELLSNASDALDKARLSALQTGGVDTEFAIRIRANKEAKTLVLSDDGIGMSREELIGNLGTIARSGTKAFMEALTAQQADVNLIGQFGVGFYSAFLVADRVVVKSKGNAWESTAGGTFTVSECDFAERGTEITLHMREDRLEYLDEAKIRELVQKHNAYLSYPINLEVEREVEVEEEVDEESAEVVEEGKVEEVKDENTEVKPKHTEKRKEWEHLNKQKPIWRKAADEVTPEEHAAFYKSLAQDWEDPIAYKQFKAEGSLEFTGLLYAPRKAPFDMFQQKDNKKRNIKLYVRRVFITDEGQDWVPEWLTFVKGVVDSDDLPLNVSRETLQQSRVIKIIQKTLVKKAIEMLEELASKPDDYAVFYEAFRKNIKLGVYDDDKNRAKLMELLRFPSSDSSTPQTSLLDYVTRAKEGQDKIYFITGDNLEAMRKSPFIERLMSKGYEVLFMADAIDEYMCQRLTEYEKPQDEKKYKFVNVAKEGALFEEEEKDVAAEFEPLCKQIKEVLADQVERVLVSSRLSKAPAAIVTGSYGWTANMARIMKAQALTANQDMAQHMQPKKIFEINPEHKLIVALKERVAVDAEDKGAKDIVQMLYDASLLASGFMLDDASSFVSRLHKLMAVGLSLDEDKIDEPAQDAAAAAEPSTKMEELD